MAVPPTAAQTLATLYDNWASTRAVWQRAGGTASVPEFDSIRDTWQELLRWSDMGRTGAPSLEELLGAVHGEWSKNRHVGELLRELGIAEADTVVPTGPLARRAALRAFFLARFDGPGLKRLLIYLADFQGIDTHVNWRDSYANVVDSVLAFMDKNGAYDSVELYQSLRGERDKFIDQINRIEAMD